LGACNGGGSSGSSSGAGNSSGTGSSSGAKLNAADYLLTGGTAATSAYKDEPNKETTEATAFQDPVPKCMQLSDSDLGPASTDHANGDMFTADGGTAIQSGARVFASADVVTKHIALVRRDDFPKCFAQALMSGSGGSGGLGGATLRSATAATPPPGATALTRAVFNVSSGSGTVEVNADLISIFSGRVESVILIVNPLQQVGTDTLNALAEQVVPKLAKQ